MTTPPIFGPAEVAKLLSAMQSVHVATLTASIVTAAGRPHSIQEVLDIQRDVHFALYPGAGHGSYEEWKKSKDQRLELVRS